VAVPLVAGLQFIFVISMLLRTACTDPGILPRSEKDEVLFNERQALISSRSITEVKNSRT
jgi:palmitoyltransferase ZDHHC9/14/18